MATLSESASKPAIAFSSSASSSSSQRFLSGNSGSFGRSSGFLASLSGASSIASSHLCLPGSLIAVTSSFDSTSNIF